MIVWTAMHCTAPQNIVETRAPGQFDWIGIEPDCIIRISERERIKMLRPQTRFQELSY